MELLSVSHTLRAINSNFAWKQVQLKEMLLYLVPHNQQIPFQCSCSFISQSHLFLGFIEVPGQM